MVLGGWRYALEYYRHGPQDFAHNRESKQRMLAMPVLAMGAEHSLAKNVETALRDFAADVRGSVIKDSGHWIAEEQPEELARLILAFLGEGSR